MVWGSQIAIKKNIHEKRVLEEFNNKNLGDYNYLYVQRDTLLLADVFENFKNKCIEIYVLDPAHFLSVLGLAWQACLNKTELKLELLTKNNMLLIVEKGVRGGIYHAMHRYAKRNSKYMKSYDKNKELLSIHFLEANNLYGWVTSQKIACRWF